MGTKQTTFEGTADAARRLGVTQTWVKRLASQGRILGAYRIGDRAWAIPTTWEYRRVRQGGGRPKLSTG